MEDNNVLLHDLDAVSARQLIREIAKDSGRIILTAHAKERMTERGITMAQVIRCLKQGSIAEGPYRDVKGNWKFTIETVSAGAANGVAAAIDNKEGAGNYIIVITTM